MKIVKVNNLPQTYEADTIYLVKSSTTGLVDIYVTDNTGTQIRSLAQATNPDSPIRLNPRRIAANFTVPTGYNAASTGPITVADGVAVTVATGAAWSVH